MKQRKLQRFSEERFLEPPLPPPLTVDVSLYQNWTPSFRILAKSLLWWLNWDLMALYIVICYILINYQPCLILTYNPGQNRLQHSVKTFLCDFFSLDRNNLLVCPPPPPKSMLDVLTVFCECNQHWMVGAGGRFSKFAIILRNFVNSLQVSQMFCPGL
jgi:hypothetical protein